MLDTTVYVSRWSFCSPSRPELFGTIFYTPNSTHDALKRDNFITAKSVERVVPLFQLYWILTAGETERSPNIKTDQIPSQDGRHLTIAAARNSRIHHELVIASRVRMQAISQSQTSIDPVSLLDWYVHTLLLIYTACRVSQQTSLGCSFTRPLGILWFANWVYCTK